MVVAFTIVALRIDVKIKALYRIIHTFFLLSVEFCVLSGDFLDQVLVFPLHLLFIILPILTVLVRIIAFREEVFIDRLGNVFGCLPLIFKIVILRPNLLHGHCGQQGEQESHRPAYGGCGSVHIYRLVDDKLVSVCKCTDNKNTKQGIGEKSEKKVESVVADSTDDALDAFSQEAPSGGEVDADKTFAGRVAIHGAAVDIDLGLSQQVVGHLA